MIRTFICINAALGGFDNAGTTNWLLDVFPLFKNELENLDAVEFPLFSIVLRCQLYHNSLDQRNCKIVSCEGRTRQERSG